MRRPFTSSLLLLPLSLAAQVPTSQPSALPPPPAPAAATPADNCGPIRQQIEARFRAGGVQPALAVVAMGESGRVVGTCGGGRRQIVLLGQVPLAAGAAATPVAVERSPRTAERAPDRAPQREPADKIPTECKDGSIVIGPDCDDPRAVRMTSAELAASLAAADAPSRAASAEAPARPASAEEPSPPASAEAPPRTASGPAQKTAAR
jgi:hypothetical protein